MKISDFKYINYPNPRERRENFIILNGERDFDFLDSFDLPIKYTKKITVPFTYETPKSGINDSRSHNYVGYHRVIEIKEISHYLLHFEGVDYQCKIYINKKLAYEHKGCYSSFYFDIKDYVVLGENDLDVIVYDSFNKSQLRGKQRTKPENYECWYTQFTGIYKDVYLEKVNDIYVTKSLFSGNENGEMKYSVSFNKVTNAIVEISYKNNIVKTINLSNSSKYEGNLVFDEYLLYSHDNPNLYDVKIYTSSDILDTFYTYFGFRTIKTNNAKIYINSNEVYLKMILNQGYYYNQGVTPTKENVLEDLLNIKYIGFNGIRIHQKQEVNCFYYLCDVLGIYLWSEIPSAYQYDELMKSEVKDQTQFIVEKNYNSPSIISYVLFNESWGIPIINDSKECQDFVDDLGKYVRSIDDTRLIILNDGWYQLTNTDVLSLHEYEQKPTKLYEDYCNKDFVTNTKIINGYGKAFANFNKYNNQPIILSEFGGASLKSSSGWGYGKKMEDITSYKEQLNNIFKNVYKLDYLAGYCYTQLTDVEQETNGLFYENRIPKLSLDELRLIINGDC